MSDSSWTEEYLTLVRDCEQRESRLTDWERGFLDSIRAQLENELPLSVRQSETLDRIWERVTAKG